MTVTPQTNTTLKAIAEALLANDNFCICGHVSPDGDCIGSQLALQIALKYLGKNATGLLAKNEKPGSEFSFLPGFDDLIYAGSFTGQCDVFICVDVPNESRLLDAATEIKQNANLSITIDHHAAPKRMSDMSYTDPDSASTTMMIWDLIGYMGISQTSEMATCTYSGLVTDTGRFQHQNTNAEVFKAAYKMVLAGADPSYVSDQFFQRRTVASIQLEAKVIEHMKLICDGAVAISWLSLRDLQEVGATKSDCEPLVNVLRSIDGVRVAAILREEENSVRGSFRAKDNTDVAQIARKFDGGGHKAAAGFTMHIPIDMAVSKVEHVLTVAMARGSM